VADALPAPSFVAVDGTLTGDDLAEAVAVRYPSYGKDLGWLFLDEPIHDAGRTWVLSKSWGAGTGQMLERLTALAPPGDGLAPVEEPPGPRSKQFPAPGTASCTGSATSS
jgi:hypothetical protein